MSDENQEPQRRKPLVSFAVGSQSVSLWENDVEGSERTFKTVTIRKTFPGKDGELTSRSVSINPAEVACLAGLLAKMQEAVIQHQETVPF